MYDLTLLSNVFYYDHNHKNKCIIKAFFLFSSLTLCDFCVLLLAENSKRTERNNAFNKLNELMMLITAKLCCN